MRIRLGATCLVVLTAMMLLGLGAGNAGAWEPTKPVEFIAPAGVGGGADVMSR
jgi:tripartite-type tricarboxylate transporter receptor subunit TctC